MRSKLIRILVALATTAACLVLAELVFRVAGPEEYEPAAMRAANGTQMPLSELVHYLRHHSDEGRTQSGPRGRMQPHLTFRQWYDRPRWDYFDDDGCILVETSSLGFRDDEFPIEKPPGELRILCVGDSFTFGSGVQAEDAWPQVLERMLAARSEGPVQVINGGFAAGSHYPPGYLDWLTDDGLAFEPDEVILGICLNDLGPAIPMLAYPIVTPEPLLGGVSKLLDHLNQRIQQTRVINEPRDYTEIVRRDPSHWQATQEAVLALRDLYEEHGIRFRVVVFPMISKLGEDYPYRGLHELVDAFLLEHDIPFLDLLERFEPLDEHDLWAHPHDQHPNDVGHLIIAEEVLAFRDRVDPR